MLGKVYRPPSATVRRSFYNGDGKLVGPFSQSPTTVLRPVVDFLLAAALLLTLNLHRYLQDPQCQNLSWPEELFLLRLARGVWIAWLTHADGFMDEALRVFLGIRLTQGLGSPTSVDRVESKMSRWAEVVAEGITVDDFPFLVGLYAASRGVSLNRRSSSAGVRPDPASVARARVDQSLVMRIDRMAATVHVWSLTPWSRVRRYKHVHVKGITLRLRQVKGILNFSFLALKKKPSPRCKPNENCDNASRRRRCNSRGDDGPGSSSRRRVSSKCGRFGGAAQDDETYDLDGIETEKEEESDVEEAFPGVGEAGERKVGDSAIATVRETVPNGSKRRLSDSNLDAETVRKLSSARFANGSKKTPAPCATIGNEAGPDKEVDRHQDCSGSKGGGGNGSTGCLYPTDPGIAGRIARRERPSSVSLIIQQPTTEPLGNLGVIKVLGEAFMRRFNAYCQQVSSTVGRMGEIKLIPTLWRWGNIRGVATEIAGTSKKTNNINTRRYEVGEILLEDVCICVDAGVWNDLLGDQVGAVFSPEFRLEVKIGPQELSTANGEGRLASEIGALVSDKLVRLLARLVMRETLKTSTLTSMVITSLALDTDARGRRQKKSVSPTPTGTEAGEGHGRGTLAQTTDPCNAAFAADTKEGLENTTGKIWRPFGAPSTPSAAISSTCSELADVSRDGSNGDGGCRRRRTSMLAFGTSTGAVPRRRSQSLVDRRRNQPSECNGYVDTTGTSRAGSYVSSDGGGSSILNGDDRGGSLQDDCRRGRQMPRTRRLRQGGSVESRLSWRRSLDPGPCGEGSRSPPPLHRSMPRRVVARGRIPHPKNDGGAEVGGSARKGWLVAGKKASNVRRGDGGSVGGRSKRTVLLGSGRDDEDKKDEMKLETVAMAPPWMDDVEACAEYEEIKPALDVIKRTVLLAVLQESNRSADMRPNRSFMENDAAEKQVGWAWGRRQGAPLKREMGWDPNKEVEESFRDELLAEREAGRDVDRLIMTALLARVRETGPNNAFKALASIELSSFIQNLASGTRLAQHLENVGIDVSHVAQSLTGLTAGEMLEGVKYKAGKVGGEARRLKTEALRIQNELLDGTGILPLLNETACMKEATSLASKVGSLSNTLTAAGTGGGSASASPFPTQNKGSWERGVAVSKCPTEGHRSVEKGLGVGGSGDVEEIDEVDVIMQVLDLMEAVESLKVGIMNGDGVALNKVEQVVSKVAGKIDVYLILAASESLLGFLLERLGKLPVGQVRFAGKGVECRVWNLDLEGIRVTRENVDLVMKGFRLPKRGAAVMTPFGPGKVKRYKKRSRCFVVNLDWTMGNGKPVKAYLQPNDIVVLEGREGKLSDEGECEGGGRRGNGKITIDHSESGAGQPLVDKAAGNKSEKEWHKSPPLDEKRAQPPEAEKGRWLSKLWSRRRSTCGVEVSGDSHATERGGEAVDCVGVRVGCRGGGDGDLRCVESRSMGRRTASAPAVVNPLRAKPLKKPKPFGGSTSNSPSAASTVKGTDGVRPEDPLIGGGGDPRMAGRIRRPNNQRSGVSRVSSYVDGLGDRCAGKIDEGRGDLTRGIMAGPTSAEEVTSAPFFVARISGVGAELTDVMWMVKQTNFPHLKAAGSLHATVSGLTIELELDSQKIPVSRVSAATLEGRDRVKNSGGKTRGLRLTRLRVSVRTVKVHFGNSALSGVFNLAASAFEAEVKRYVVENVEATVRKSLTALLEIVNKSDKWKILCRVGERSGSGNGGGSGSESQSGVKESDGGGDGAGDGSRLERVGTAIDKVLAKSRSYHVVWAADHGCSDKDNLAEERDRGQEQNGGESSRGNSAGSGPGRRLAGGDADEHRGDDGIETNASRQMLAKIIFRGRLAGATGRSQSTRQVSGVASPSVTRAVDGARDGRAPSSVKSLGDEAKQQGGGGDQGELSRWATEGVTPVQAEDLERRG